ncbi:uncharacterized protein [Medicago truncatula]|uniref:uncharacterized protein n=1 Tax=Medicago truncatula TaxID=3880 RepID=UPI0019670A4F|nr:uncharacterized protein LOC120579562 [Medicago truncatula]
MENANANANISVWWDIETCQFPTNNFDDIYYIAKNIHLALSNVNLHGRLTISAYGNSDLIPSKVRRALYIMGTSLRLLPTKGGVYNGIMPDLLIWALQNPPPANILLISSDDSFSSFLHEFSMQGFNIILSAPSPVDASLAAAANIFWHWPTYISWKLLNAIQQMTMENANTNISVWWDVGNCQIPTNFDSIDCIVNNIRLALLKANLRGKLSISAYGNTNLIASGLQHALSTAGIPLCHVPSGDVYKVIMFDMLKWVLKNHAPASIMLLSSDVRFSKLLYDLSVRRYNILLSAPSKVCASLASTANVIWLWSTLISGGSPLKTAEQLSASLLDQVQDGESNI